MKHRNFITTGFIILIALYVLKTCNNRATITNTDASAVPKVIFDKKNKKYIKQESSYNTIQKNRLEKEGFHVEKNQEEELAQILKKEKESEKALREFSDKVYLDMNIELLKEFIFEDKSEEEVAVLSGKNSIGHNITIIASRKVPDETEIIKLLNDNREDFLPDTASGVRLENLTPALKIGSKNGFQSIDIWEMSDKGRSYYLFFAPREDGKGSYGIFLEGDNESLSLNDERYEEQLQRIKARKE